MTIAKSSNKSQCVSKQNQHDEILVFSHTQEITPHEFSDSKSWLIHKQLEKINSAIVITSDMTP